jgi:hypothetical protein
LAVEGLIFRNLQLEMTVTVECWNSPICDER